MGAIDTLKDCLIVCAGEVSREALARCALPRERLVIAADAGYLRCRELGLTPQLVLGDFDSAPRPETTAETQVFPAHKDDTDCMLAVKEGLRRGCTRFTLLGGTGGRLDHTLANIQTLAYLAQRGAEARMLDDRHTLRVVAGRAGFSLELPREGDYLSLFALGDHCTGVTLEGVEYPLTRATLENSFPLGVSNHITGERCRIAVERGLLLLMTVSPPPAPHRFPKNAPQKTPPKFT